MASIPIPQGAPSWFSTFVRNVERAFVSAVPTGPQKLSKYTSTNLPDPIAFADCVILVDTGTGLNIGVSNGVSWINTNTGTSF